MPSSEKIISPGVFTNEIDQSFLPTALGDIGAAIIGPTVKGPPLVPTVVNSYSEFEQIFGSTVKSGSNSFSYLTSLTARQYLKNQGALTVVRIMAGTYSQAFALVPTGSGGSGTGSSQQAASAGTPGEPFTVGANTENIDSDSAFEDTADAGTTGGGTKMASFKLNTQGYGNIFKYQ